MRVNRNPQFISGRGVSATRIVCNDENGVQIPAPDPISLALVDGRCLSAPGMNREQKGTIQEHLTSLPSTLALRLRVSRRRRSVRPSSRWSSGRAGLRNSCAPQADRVAIGLCRSWAALSCGGAASFAGDGVLPVLPGVQFGHVISECHGFWWWYSGICIPTCFVIALFWIAWVVSGDRK